MSKIEEFLQNWIWFYTCSLYLLDIDEYISSFTVSLLFIRTNFLIFWTNFVLRLFQLFYFNKFFYGIFSVIEYFFNILSIVQCKMINKKRKHECDRIRNNNFLKKFPTKRENEINGEVYCYFTQFNITAIVIKVQKVNDDVIDL